MLGYQLKKAPALAEANSGHFFCVPSNVPSKKKAATPRGDRKAGCE
jgi:hypothetical protein